MDKKQYYYKNMIDYYIKYLKDDGRNLYEYIDSKTGRKDSYLSVLPRMMNMYIQEYSTEVTNTLNKLMYFIYRSNSIDKIYQYTLDNFINSKESNKEDYYNYETVFGGDKEKALKDMLCNLSLDGEIDEEKIREDLKENE